LGSFRAQVEFGVLRLSQPRSFGPANASGASRAQVEFGVLRLSQPRSGACGIALTLAEC
jgi:hypothetical protein